MKSAAENKDKMVPGVQEVVGIGETARLQQDPLLRGEGRFRLQVGRYLSRTLVGLFLNRFDG